MKTVIEKAESHWALRYVGGMRDEMRVFQRQIGKAANKLVMTFDMGRLLTVVHLVPKGIVHRYESGWSLTFCAGSKKEAQQIQATISLLLNASRAHVIHQYTYSELTS